MLVLLLVLLPTATTRRFVRPVEASETIYIMADGSVSPSTAKITSVDNVTYTFTDNNRDSIVVQRDNVVIDGAGYALQGRQLWNSKGIDLMGRSNVTIKNMEIREFFFGIWLKTSSSNSITGNNITYNKVGVRLSDSSSNRIFGNNITANMDHNIYVERSSNNNISENIITARKIWVSLLYYSFFGIYLHHSSSNSIAGNNIVNSQYGIQLSSSHNNRVSGNEMANNTYGILLWRSTNNTIHGNNMTDNHYGITLSDSSNNIIYHDNFVNNTEQAYSHNSTNVWDDGYPSGGNYWSDHDYKYPDAKEMDESGTWDKPYVIDENNQDNYPLMNLWTAKGGAPPLAEEEGVPFWMQWRLWAIAAVGIVVLTAAYLKKRKSLIAS